MKINSVEYWDSRFNRDWIQNGGHEQTEWFGRLLIENLPSFVADDVETSCAHIADFGCAFGECAALIKNRFPKARVTGLDFSSVAIEHATKTYGECEFVLHDMLKDSYPCDVAVCSNVLEHFKDPAAPFLRLFESASKYVVVMVPFERHDEIAEHEYVFTVEFFPLQVGHFSMAYSRVITSVDPRNWPGNQLLVVYGRAPGENVQGIGALSKMGVSIEDRLSLCQKSILSISNDVLSACALVSSVQNGQDGLMSRIENLTAQYGEVLQFKKGLAKVIESQNEALAKLTTLECRQAEVFQFVNAILWRMKEHERIQGERTLRNRILSLPVIGSALRKMKRGVMSYRKDGFVKATRFFVDKYANRIKKPVTAREIVACELKKGKYNGVYVIAGIPWDVPIFQRPQQMALAFLRRGYLVIYLEYVQNNPSGTCISPMDGLWVLTVDDFGAAMEGLKECIISVYSTILCWRDTAKFTRAFAEDNSVVYEYIDHFDEKISGEATESLRAFFNYLVKSDMPVTYLASARFLLNELKEKTGKEVVYVANGVDVQHFSRESIAAIEKRIQLPECLRTKKVKIGYFGALAPWLDYELISAVVCLKQDWEFVFIGPDYYDGASKLPKDAANCHWLGPVAYNDLAAYASRFDVAILPFQSGDLAKSTSPLKLFEYFALGKPVVVTSDMLECTAYEEVFAGDGVNGFIAALEQAVEKRNDEKFHAALRRIAQDNTWDSRAGQLIDGIGDRH